MIFIGATHIYMNPSRAPIPLIRPHQCDSEGGRIRGVVLYYVWLSPPVSSTSQMHQSSFLSYFLGSMSLLHTVGPTIWNAMAFACFTFVTSLTPPPHLPTSLLALPLRLCPLHFFWVGETGAIPHTGHVRHLAFTSLPFFWNNSGYMTLLHIHQCTFINAILTEIWSLPFKNWNIEGQKIIFWVESKNTKLLTISNS